MTMNEADTRYHLIDPVLRGKGYVSRDHITLETVLTPPPVEPTGPKGRRRKGPGRTDYLLCVQVPAGPKAMPVAVLEAKKEAEDPLNGMQQARGYADTLRFDVKYVFSTNGHRYGEYDRFTELITGPVQFCDFPSHPDLTARYCKDTGIDLTQPGAAMLFQADSAAWSQSRYYQDAAIRASFEKILLDRQAGQPPRVLLTLATGAGKTIIATNLLWRLSQAGELPKPALFLCDRDELREQAYTKLTAAFGDNARIVRTERGANAAANARIHIATYQALGLDDEEGFASFLTEHYGEDAFSAIIIDECHRSAWGRWSEVLRRNPSAIHIGLTATPRKLEESDTASKEDQEITANNRRYFGEPVYEYALIQAQEDGYLLSPIKFYQMVGRGTRIHEETQKYKFWLYDYTDVTSLFGTDFVTKPPRPGGGRKGGDDDDDGGGGENGRHVAEMRGQYVVVNEQGRFILSRRDGRDTPIPVDEYRRQVIQRVIAEAHNLDEFRALWIEAQKRRSLIDHLLGDNFRPEVIREIDHMTDFDLYDFFGHQGYHARALKRPERGGLFISSQRPWFDGMDPKAAIVLKGLGHQFAAGGTDALETPALREVPEIKLAGGLDALRVLGKPTEVSRGALRAESATIRGAAAPHEPPATQEAACGRVPGGDVRSPDDFPPSARDVRIED